MRTNSVLKKPLITHTAYLDIVEAFNDWRKQYAIKLKLHCGFEVLTAVVVKSSIFRDITPCSPLKVRRSLEGTCRLHLQGGRISQGRKQNSACHLLHAASLPVIFVDPVDGGDMFLRNVCWLNGLHALYPRRWNYSEFTLFEFLFYYCLLISCNLHEILKYTEILWKYHNL
jgi:hypothetical protein